MPEHRNPFEAVDVRVRILVIILVSLSALMLKTEIALLLCLVFMWIWLILFGCVKKALQCTAAYGALYGLLFLMKNTDMLGNLPLLTVYIRRLMLPVMAAAPVINAPTGCLIAALNKMKIPRAATLSLTVMFRFMPTLSAEYHNIRESQKIRGIGASFFTVLRHPIQTAECILVPMLIRTSKTADELSASVQVRGMKLGGAYSSYRKSVIDVRDMVLMVSGTMTIVLIYLTDVYVRRG
ncbi:MAG: energy-coupling factor transporter transmembrane protein EcfT [Oscillospiraceae bacterium]|nr:energy-coupling factor transporter transmembrane protein EcfT [Oscillospiraceae bacterium]